MARLLQDREGGRKDGGRPAILRENWLNSRQSHVAASGSFDAEEQQNARIYRYLQRQRLIAAVRRRQNP